VKQNHPDEDTDALFALPVDQFTAARNALAARLKKSGKSDDADRVKALKKPSVSAWAVNQLYWKHRNSFDRLMATGAEFRQAQAAQLAGKPSSMRERAEARREVLGELLRLADRLLRDSGHNPASETLRRISTTLEALSAYASDPNAPTPGRLQEDLEPPGFEALAGFIPTTRVVKSPSTAGTYRQPDKTHDVALAAARLSVKNAEISLKQALDRARSTNAELKHSLEKAKDAAKQKREAEEMLKKAIAAAEQADQSASSAATEAEAASNNVQHAEHVLEQATQELQTIQGRSGGRKTQTPTSLE
jgi:hypothetical protein